MIYPKDIVGGERTIHVTSASTGAASVSATALGTGIAMIPVYGWIQGSAFGSATVYNGTGGSQLVNVWCQAGGTWEFSFWDDTIVPNKALVLEANAAIGTHEFHVFAVARRLGAGQSATGL